MDICRKSWNGKILAMYGEKIDDEYYKTLMGFDPNDLSGFNFIMCTGPASFSFL